MSARGAVRAAMLGAVLVLAGCSGGDSDVDFESEPEPTAQTDVIPSPMADQATALVDTLATIIPALADSPDDTVDLARNTCTSIIGGANNVDDAIRVRFAVDGTEPTDEQVQQIREVIEAEPWCA